jgi:hypothetical protein
MPRKGQEIQLMAAGHMMFKDMELVLRQKCFLKTLVRILICEMG